VRGRGKSERRVLAARHVAQQTACVFEGVDVIDAGEVDDVDMLAQRLRGACAVGDDFIPVDRRRRAESGERETTVAARGDDRRRGLERAMDDRCADRRIAGDDHHTPMSAIETEAERGIDLMTERVHRPDRVADAELAVVVPRDVDVGVERAQPPQQSVVKPRQEARREVLLQLIPDGVAAEKNDGRASIHPRSILRVDGGVMSAIIANKSQTQQESPLIIFGSRGIRMKGESGSFYCPQCAGTRQYTRRKIRRFFTLYFIPLIPLDVIGEYIECHYCAGGFKPEVLQYDPRVDQRRVDMQVRTNLKRALVAVLVADGVPSSAARDAAFDAIRTVAGDTNLTRPDLDAVVDAAVKRGANATNDVAAIVELLDYAARENLIRATMTIALADGELSAAENRQIRALAQAAGITEAHLAGIMATAPRMAIAPPAPLPS